jgi:predicted dienelactone hydrolase
MVAALDHSEVVAAELSRKEGETAEQKNARINAWIASRVPDISFLIDQTLGNDLHDVGLTADPFQIGIAGHSFGGWTALAVPDIEQRIRSVVALAPGGSSQRKPGIIPGTLNFKWGRNVPTIYLVAENDASLPLSGMYELFERTPSSKQMFVLRRADHMHFMDHTEQMHEMVRKFPWGGELEWLPKDMLPIDQLCSGDQSHLFLRGLALAHLDATLKQKVEAKQFLLSDIDAELASKDIQGFVYRS